MDFFSTGGFQQLFKELNCTDEIYANDEFNQFNLLSSTEDNFHFYIDNNQPSIIDERLEDTYQILNITDSTQYPITENCNNLMQVDENSNWLDGLLKFNEDINDAETDYFLPTTICTNPETLMTREIAEWEDKFLDNFIEIPELIDILPEKTPLCTDTCELFLRESTENLKLDRAAKTNGTAAALDADKGYVCTFGTCAKIYAKPTHLKAHMRRHLGEKPYVCTWPSCTWKFSRSDELARHRRSHSGVKPYKCDYCLKCFARSDHLTKHRKVHERRLLAATEAGIVLPSNVFHVRPGRRRKNAI